MKITEIEGFPKELLKGKTLKLYKAFIFEEPNTEMKVSENVELMGITPEAAVNLLLEDIPLEVFDDKWQEAFEDLIGKPSSDYNKTKPMWKNMTITKHENTVTIDMDNTTICFAVFEFPMKELKKVDLVDGSEMTHFLNDILGICLKDKTYRVNVEEKRLVSFRVKADAETEQRFISNLKMEDI